MLRKRLNPTLVPQTKKRRKTAYAIEEIKFDPSAREDYLTGFHKRKLQRIKHAKEESARKERQDRIEARRILRDGRKTDLEKHVQAVDAMVKANESDGEGEAEVSKEPNGEVEEMETVDREEEYVDEDRFTTVTVEAVDVSRDGLCKVIPPDENPNDVELDETASSTKGPGVSSTEKGRRTNQQPGGVQKKQKKKNFRYETKAERKRTRHKEKMGNKIKASARKM